MWCISAYSFISFFPQVTDQVSVLWGVKVLGRNFVLLWTYQALCAFEARWLQGELISVICMTVWYVKGGISWVGSLLGCQRLWRLFVMNPSIQDEGFWNIFPASQTNFSTSSYLGVEGFGVFINSFYSYYVLQLYRTHVENFYLVTKEKNF